MPRNNQEARPVCSSEVQFQTGHDTAFRARIAAVRADTATAVALAATPPDELTEEEAELYRSLIGPVDFTIPTPSVVRDGFLAPYQELAWLTEPLDSEVDWLREHDLRFRQLVTDLHQQDRDGSLSFPEWVITRLRARSTGQGEPEVPWASFQRRHPALARAGVRFLASAGLTLPEGAPRLAAGVRRARSGRAPRSR